MQDLTPGGVGAKFDLGAIDVGLLLAMDANSTPRYGGASDRAELYSLTVVGAYPPTSPGATTTVQTPSPSPAVGSGGLFLSKKIDRPHFAGEGAPSNSCAVCFLGFRGMANEAANQGGL